MIAIVGERCNDRVSSIPFHEDSYSYKKLKSLGLHWDGAFNVFADDDTYEGEIIQSKVWILQSYLEIRYGQIVLLGRRVIDAFCGKGHSFLRKVNKRYYTMPHPSGLNRWWNSNVNNNKAINFIKEHKLDGGY